MDINFKSAFIPSSLKNLLLRNKLSFLFFKHFSFLILFSSSLAFYFFNLWLKNILNDFEYGEYGLLNSYLTIIMSFSLLGSDQLLVRIAKKNDRKLIISKDIFRINFISLIFFSLIGPALLFFFLGNSADYFLTVILTILSGLSILSYSLLRVYGAFTAAQIQKNIWKFLAFLFCLLVFYFSGEISINLILILINLSLFLNLIFAIRPIFQIQVTFASKTQINFNLWLGFTISMLIISLITNTDRFLIKNYIGVENVGHYFFLQNLFLFPLTQIQLYSGFKELVDFKKNFNIQILNKSMRKNTAIGVSASIGLMICIFIIDKLTSLILIDWSNDFVLIALLLSGGIIRIIYSVLSAAMGAVGDSRSIQHTNIWTLFCFIILFMIFHFVGFTICTIPLFFLTVWIFRSWIYYIYLKNYEVRINPVV